MNNERPFHFTLDQIDAIDAALVATKDKVHKASAINTAVLVNYLKENVDNDHVAYLEFTYETWQKLIECVSDILDDAEAALTTASAALHREWD